MTNFCEDCRWFKRPWWDEPDYAYAQCTSPRRSHFVSRVARRTNCEQERGDRGDCGPSAELFEPKPVKRPRRSLWRRIFG